jgi:hypothetical protein
MSLLAITIRRAPPNFGGWAEVRSLILEAFAYMEDRIDPPSSALRLTPQSIAAESAKGVTLSTLASSPWHPVFTDEVLGVR